MGFRGWPVEALEFYEGLEADNSKAYWEEHRHVYEEMVRAPMEALLEELSPEWGDWKIFRPYRDIRFSPDKSPYKTHIGATIGHGYVQLSADGLAAACGMYHMASDQLERYRGAVSHDRRGAELVSLVDAVTAEGIEITAHDVLKTAPRGHPKDHPRIELLRLKGLITWREWPAAAWMGTPKAKDRIVEFLRRSKPIADWLESHVGPSTLPQER